MNTPIGNTHTYLVVSGQAYTYNVGNNYKQYMNMYISTYMSV